MMRSRISSLSNSANAAEALSTCANKPEIRMGSAGTQRETLVQEVVPLPLSCRPTHRFDTVQRKDLKGHNSLSYIMLESNSGYELIIENRKNSLSKHRKNARSAPRKNLNP